MPNTDYQLFTADRVPELKEKYDKPTSELFKMITEEWHNLKDNQKEKWYMKAIPSQEAYKNKMRKFERNDCYVIDKGEREIKSMKKEERFQRAKSSLKLKSEEKEERL